MAFDSRNKRASALGLNPCVPVLPNPDGAMAAGDRAHLCRVYRGSFDVVATNPAPVGWRIFGAGSPRAGIRGGKSRASVRARA